jgi:hypothetical protein
MQTELSCTMKNEVGFCNSVCAIELKPLFVGLVGVTVYQHVYAVTLFTV